MGDICEMHAAIYALRVLGLAFGTTGNAPKSSKINITLLASESSPRCLIEVNSFPIRPSSRHPIVPFRQSPSNVFGRVNQMVEPESREESLLKWMNKHKKFIHSRVAFIVAQSPTHFTKNRIEI